MTADLAIHDRLGEGRLVALVVAEAAVAEHVDDHRLVEFHPVFGRDLGGIDDGFRVVAVDVEDRRLDHLGDVGRVGRRAREARVRREADLVVDDEVQRAARRDGRADRKGRDNSATTPWPAKAASPWSSSGSTLARSSSGTISSRLRPKIWSCLARALPITTGLTISRCEGLAVSDSGPCCRRTRGPKRRPGDT